ncbi:hypothetical protein M422DRAFT_214410 [Sphaerobolus stellatus SS14]|uniref:Unplaced genomic scaffold SPHSTscaffold_170, whole genome shotgun sequence n=1 Tax=Sphaerobolus stellatus (strain SS14) TaxID=990650 RepID=A0A0C9V1G0_SPHS4|nr:hypothetical protein M422DRAFT_214410 [Sphaerobolus stellatus SS14]
MPVPAVLTNKAPATNPSTADLHLATSGSDWDWAVFALMLLSDLALIGWTYTRPRGARLFDYLGIIILTTVTIDYFTMASNLGHTPIQVQFLRDRAPGTTRAIWYTRYIDWFITTPLLLTMLLMSTGINIASMLPIIFMDLVMVVCALIGALTHSAYKWGYFAFSLAALVYVWACVWAQGPSAAGFLGSDVKVHFLRCAGYLMFLWFLYPICWALSEGANVISPTSEMIFYGILDLLTKPVFILFLLLSLKDIEFDRFGFQSLKASETGTIDGPNYSGRPAEPGMTHANRAPAATTAGAGAEARGGTVAGGAGNATGAGAVPVAVAETAPRV